MASTPENAKIVLPFVVHRSRERAGKAGSRPNHCRVLSVATGTAVHVGPLSVTLCQGSRVAYRDLDSPSQVTITRSQTQGGQSIKRRQLDTDAKRHRGGERYDDGQAGAALGRARMMEKGWKRDGMNMEGKGQTRKKSEVVEAVTKNRNSASDQRGKR